MFNVKFFEEIRIFVFECLSGMLCFLICNVIEYGFDLGMPVGKCSVPFLPIEFSVYPIIIIDEIGRIVLNIPYEI